MNQGDGFWGTTNLKVASVVCTVGGKIRSTDPTTRVMKDDGSQQVTFWFEAGSGRITEKMEMERTWADMRCDIESPIRYMRAVLENRETLLGLVKRTEVVRFIRTGEQTLLVAENARPELKKAILKHI